MKLAQLSILAVLAIASQSAFAQVAPATIGGSGSGSTMSPSSSGSSAQGGSATGGATDASAVTNAGSALVGDINFDENPGSPTATVDAPKGEMANTGGEPEIMLIAGLLLASGGLLLRRKSAQSL